MKGRNRRNLLFMRILWMDKHSSPATSIEFKVGETLILQRFSYFRVRLAAHVSNGLTSRIHPVVGRIQPKARVSIVRWNLKEAGCEEHTNSRANLWSDGQKSHMRLCMGVRLHAKSKPNNYTESCMINEADGWRGRNV